LRKIVVLILLSFLVTSCTGKIASFEFESYQWQGNKPVDLSFHVDENKTTDLTLEIRSMYGIPYKMLSMDFVLTNTNGEKFIVSKDVEFNEETLDCSGDFCDQKIKLFDGFKLREGDYKLRATHFNMDSDLYGLIEFRLLEE
jgi:hypothetical protein